jgi:hypothetical protein
MIGANACLGQRLGQRAQNSGLKGQDQGINHGFCDPVAKYRIKGRAWVIMQHPPFLVQLLLYIIHIKV